MSEAVTIETSGDVAVIRLDDGKANALPPDVLAALQSALDQAEEAGQAVLLLGRPGKFSAGFDLGVMRNGGPEAGIAMVKAGAELGLRLARFPAPVVIGATGHALAMGAVLLMAADTRIGAEGPYKIGFNEVAISMTTPIFLAEFARERLSKRHFTKAVVQAEIYDPAAALDAGFFDQVVPEGQLFDTALAEAERLAKLPRAAYAKTKLVVHGAMLDAIERGLDENLQSTFSRD
jgi:enoyl-CoA hydratase